MVRGGHSGCEYGEQEDRERCTESGYVFFPLGEYQKIQAVLGDTEAGSAITVSGNITR
jgi:hypothetical protein